MKEVVDILESRVLPVQRILVFQDVQGSLYAFDWLEGVFYWARPAPPVEVSTNGFDVRNPTNTSMSGGERSNNTLYTPPKMIYPSSEAKKALGGSLVSFVDSSCEGMISEGRDARSPSGGAGVQSMDVEHWEDIIRRKTSRLIPSPDGGLTFIDGFEEFIPVPADLSLSAVLQQTPFSSGLFPGRYLLGSQSQRIVNLRLEDGLELNHDAPEPAPSSPFATATPSLPAISAAPPPLQIPMNMITIAGVSTAAPERISWALTLQQLGSLGESPLRPTESECRLRQDESELCLTSERWNDNFLTTTCSEVLINSALKQAVYVEGDFVSINLCKLAERLLGTPTMKQLCPYCRSDEPSPESSRGERPPLIGVIEIQFPFEILNIYPLKSLSNDIKGLTLADPILPIEPGSFPVSRGLHKAVQDHLTNCAQILAEESGSFAQLQHKIKANRVNSQRRFLSSEETQQSNDSMMLLPRVLGDLSHKQKAVRALLTARPSLEYPFTPALPTMVVKTNVLELLPPPPPPSSLPQIVAEGLPPNALYVAVLSPSKSYWLINAGLAAFVFMLIGWWMGRQQLQRRTGSVNIEDLTPTSREKDGLAPKPSSETLLQTSAASTRCGQPESLVPIGSSLRELVDNGRFAKTFSSARLLGRGGFGFVFRAEHRLEPGHTPYALKIVMCEAPTTPDFDLSNARYFREVATNRDILSKYIVRYFTWWCEEPQFLPIWSELPLGTMISKEPALANSPRAEKTETLFASRRNLDTSQRPIYESPVRLANRKTPSFWPDTRKTESLESADAIHFATESSSVDHPPTPDEVRIEKKTQEEVGVKLERPTCKICLVIQMEWCPGKTLRHWLSESDRERPVLLDDNGSRLELHYFEHLMKGIRDIHSQGIIHRDVKPENIFVDGPKLKIGDFGLSKLVRTSQRRLSGSAVNTDMTLVSFSGQNCGEETQTGCIIGTPSYAAPEVGFRDCCEKSDIYSCGLILIELLCRNISTSHERHTILDAFRKDKSFPRDFDRSELFDPWKLIVRAMCNDEPACRPSAQSVIDVLKRASRATAAQHGAWIEEVLRGENQRVTHIWATTFANDFVTFLKDYDDEAAQAGEIAEVRLSYVEREIWRGDAILRNILFIDFGRFDAHVRGLRAQRSGAESVELTAFNSASLFLQLFYQRLKDLLLVHCAQFLKQFLNKVEPFIDQLDSARRGCIEKLANGHLDLHIIARNATLTRSVRDLRAEDTGHLINLIGVVTRVTDVRPELVTGVFECEGCRHEVGGIRQFYKFTQPIQCVNSGCSNRAGWNFVQEKSSYINWQKLKLQESTDDDILAKVNISAGGAAPPGTIPRVVDLIVRGPMVDSCKPGDTILTTGFVVAIPDVASLIRAKELPSEVRAEKNKAIRSEQAVGDESGGVKGLSKLGVREITYKLAFMASNVEPASEGAAGALASTLAGSELEAVAASMGATLVELFSMAPPKRTATRAVQKFQALLNTPICRWNDITPELHKRFRKIASAFNTVDLLLDQVAPYLWGYEDAKKGILTLLVGGVEKISNKDQTRLRGDLNILLIGNPGCGKSQLLKFVQSVAQRAVYASGQCSTAAGLTASVHKDFETGESVVEPGALILADKGVCCIDEFDLMDSKDMIAIHEAMEQQTISVSKAGIQASMNARASVICACTPIDGHYKANLPLQSNVRLTPTILSRFDLAFVLTESDGADDFTRMATHRFQAAARRENLQSIDELKLYLKIAKSFKPKLSPEAKHIIIHRYIKERQHSRNVREKNRADARATARMLESMIRVSEAFAKLSFCKTVSVAHAQEAIKLADNQRRRQVEEVLLDDLDSEDEAGPAGVADMGDGALKIKSDEFDLIQTILVSRIAEHDENEDLQNMEGGKKGVQTKELVDWFIQEKANGDELMKPTIHKIITRMKKHGVVYRRNDNLVVHENYAGLPSTNRQTLKKAAPMTAPASVASESQGPSAATNALIDSTFLEELYLDPSL